MYFHSVSSFFILLMVGWTVVFMPSSVQSQYNSDHPWYVNPNGGVTLLFGDLNSQNSISGRIPDELDMAFGIRAGRYFSPVFGLYIESVSGRFRGANEARNLEFKSSFTETGLGIKGSLTDLIFGKKSRFLNVYVFGGASFVFFRSEAKNTATGKLEGLFGYSNGDDPKKSAPETGFVFPMGAGLDFKVHPRWFLNVQTGFRASLIDEFDGLIKGSQNDAYYYSSFGLSYYFNLGKPKSKEPVLDGVPVDTMQLYADKHVWLEYDIPSDLSSYDHFRMKSIIHKGKIDGKAQLIQILPVGFNVQDTAIADASRTEFSNYTLRLYWDELPKDTAFEVSYDVELDQIFGKMPMSSILYLDQLSREFRFKTEVTVERKIIEDLFAELEALEEDELQIDKATTAVDLVEFKVQIAASFRKQLSIADLENKHNLHGKITEERDGAWYKYTTGAFPTYQRVRAHRSKVIEDHKAEGAFVVVYYKGERLSNIKELIAVSPEHYPLPIDPALKKRSPLCYRVQILALRETSASPYTLRQTYGIDDVVNEEIYHNWRKYTVGDCLTRQAALNLTEELKSKGISEAFPVLYKEGERSPK